MMETQDFVDRLFSEYEESPELRDFKEEILSNLEARIASLAAKGLDKGAAFEKAAGELGDISALADQISLKKKQEVFQDAYLGMRKYLKPLRVAWYVLSGAWLALGLVIALVVYLTGEEQSALEAFWEPNKRIVSFFGVLAGMVPPAAAIFTFLGLTQETATRNPLSPKRAVWYALAAAALSFGIILSPLTYFATDRRLMEAVAVLIPFVIPALGLLIFLILTEKDTRKPWVKARYEKEARANQALFNDPVAAARFGMVSASLWIFAAGLFILLGFLVGFQFSWLVFVFAVACQLAIQGLMMKGSSYIEKNRGVTYGDYRYSGRYSVPPGPCGQPRQPCEDPRRGPGSFSGGGGGGLRPGRSSPGVHRNGGSGGHRGSQYQLRAGRGDPAGKRDRRAGDKGVHEPG
jgi:uncharacterized membrane protein YccF (DUF307 family)